MCISHVINFGSSGRGFLDLFFSAFFICFFCDGEIDFFDVVCALVLMGCLLW